MKKLKLRKWVKVVLIIMLAITSVCTYNLVGTLGALAQTNDLYLGLDVLCICLLFGQFGGMAALMED
jgi:hypothetical protein